MRDAYIYVEGDRATEKFLMVEVFNISYNDSYSETQFVFKHSSDLDFSNSEEARNSFCMCPFVHRTSCKYDKPYAKIETYVLYKDLGEEIRNEQIITYQEFICLRNRFYYFCFGLSHKSMPQEDKDNMCMDMMRHQTNAIGLRHYPKVDAIFVTISKV